MIDVVIVRLGVLKLGLDVDFFEWGDLVLEFVVIGRGDVWGRLFVLGIKFY